MPLCLLFLLKKEHLSLSPYLLCLWYYLHVSPEQFYKDFFLWLVAAINNVWKHQYISNKMYKRRAMIWTTATYTSTKRNSKLILSCPVSVSEVNHWNLSWYIGYRIYTWSYFWGNKVIILNLKKKKSL